MPLVYPESSWQVPWLHSLFGNAPAVATGIASCVAFYAGRYLTRRGVPRDGLRVTAEFTMAGDRPARVTAVQLRVTVPAALPN